MSYYYLAFFMGFFGSLHCAVMCGPLLIALQGNQRVYWKQSVNKMMYQLGRILMYGFLGLLLGIIGNVASVQGWQQAFSILTGGTLILIGLFYFFAKNFQPIAQFQSRAIQPFARMMGRWVYKPGGSFIAGMLNGILPCGMVYMALISAMNAEGVLASFRFMVLFGLGTLPLMLLLSIASLWTRKLVRIQFSSIIPFLYLLMGVWFLLRGANLNIPYLSPLLNVDGAINCM